MFYMQRCLTSEGKIQPTLGTVIAIKSKKGKVHFLEYILEVLSVIKAPSLMLFLPCS